MALEATGAAAYAPLSGGGRRPSDMTGTINRQETTINPAQLQAIGRIPTDATICKPRMGPTIPRVPVRKVCALMYSAVCSGALNFVTHRLQAISPPPCAPPIMARKWA